VTALAFAACLALWALPTAIQAEATLTITPPAGPYGTAFTHRVTGLPPGIGVTAFVRDPTGAEFDGPGLGVVPPNGEWLVGSYDAWRAERGEPLGESTMIIKTIDGMTTLASATFTVTDPAGQAAVPSVLPRAGETTTYTPLFAILGVVLLGFGSLFVYLSRQFPAR